MAMNTIVIGHCLWDSLYLPELKPWLESEGNLAVDKVEELALDDVDHALPGVRVNQQVWTKPLGACKRMYMWMFDDFFYFCLSFQTTGEITIDW